MKLKNLNQAQPAIAGDGVGRPSTGGNAEPVVRALAGLRGGNGAMPKRSTPGSGTRGHRPPHGYSMYSNYRCRCDVCKDAAHVFKWRLRYGPDLPVLPRGERNVPRKIAKWRGHALQPCGTNAGYNRGCRCDLCREAHRVDAWKRRHPAINEAPAPKFLRAVKAETVEHELARLIAAQRMDAKYGHRVFQEYEHVSLDQDRGDGFSLLQNVRDQDVLL